MYQNNNFLLIICYNENLDKVYPIYNNYMLNLNIVFYIIFYQKFYIFFN